MDLVVWITGLNIRHSSFVRLNLLRIDNLPQANPYIDALHQQPKHLLLFPRLTKLPKEIISTVDTFRWDRCRNSDPI
jgi:hypothetical protein